MYYVLTPARSGLNFWYADQYAYYERKTPSKKHDIQSRWDARKLRRRIAEHISQKRSQPLKKL